MGTPVYPLVSRENRLVSLDQAGPASFTGTLANANVTITACSDLTGVAIGDVLVHPSIVPGSIIVSMDNAGHTVNMNNAATGNAVAATIKDATRQPGLNGLKIHLFKAPHQPAVGDLLATYTAIEADFDGYVAKVLTLTFGYIDPANFPTVRSQLLSWLMATAVTPNTVYGYWVDDGVNVVMAEAFPVPRAMATVGAELALVVQDSFPPQNGVIIL